MEPFYKDDWIQVYSGDCRDVMRSLPEKSVHTIVTSPPYYGLREYGTAQWEGGDPDCDHTKAASGRGSNIPQTKNPNADYPIAPHRGGNPNECVKCGAIRIEPTVWGGDRNHEHMWGAPVVVGRTAGGEREYGSSDRGVGRGPAVALPTSNFCECGAWRGALGLEPTPDLYVEHLVEVFNEAWRVLRDDGIFWLNIGDSYSTSSGRARGEGGQDGGKIESRVRPQVEGMKPKDLIGVPWMAAFALRSAGWYLRGDLVWNKPNVMPESVKDRPTRSHEFIFMLTKNQSYYFDMEAVKEPVGDAMRKAAQRKPIEAGRTYQHDEESRFGKTSPNRVWSDPEAMARLLAGRHMRDVLTVPTRPYSGAHYAVFPPDLVTPLIKAATSEKGCCPQCGAPWDRVTQRTNVPRDMSRPQATRAVEIASAAGLTEEHFAAIRSVGINDAGKAQVTQTGFGKNDEDVQRLADEAKEVLGGYYREFLLTAEETTGWQRSCEHETDSVPSTVLDPFGGSGTLAMVAQQLGRRAITIDLNPEYIKQQMVRNLQTPLGL